MLFFDELLGPLALFYQLLAFVDQHIVLLRQTMKVLFQLVYFLVFHVKVLLVHHLALLILTQLELVFCFNFMLAVALQLLHD